MLESSENNIPSPLFVPTVEKKNYIMVHIIRSYMTRRTKEIIDEAGVAIFWQTVYIVSYIRRYMQTRTYRHFSQNIFIRGCFCRVYSTLITLLYSTAVLHNGKQGGVCALFCTCWDVRKAGWAGRWKAGRWKAGRGKGTKASWL